MSASLRVIRAVAGKDLRIALTQKLLLVLGLALPANFLILFMLFALSGGQAPTAVVVQDSGPLAAKFVDTMRNAHSFQVRLMDASEASREMGAGHIVAIVTIPPSFDADVQAGRTIHLPVTVNNLQTDFTNDIRRAVPLAVTAFYGTEFPGRLSVHAQEVDTQAADTGYIPYLAVSVAVMSLLVAGILQGAMSAATEHESRTVLMFALSPARRWAVVLGKLLAALAVNAVSAAIVVGLVVLLVGSLPSHPLEVVVTACLLMVTFASLGVLIGNLVRRRTAAIPLSISIAMPLFFMSGPFGPPNWLGGAQGVVAHLSPAYYGISTFQHAFHGYVVTQTSLVTDALVLGGMAAVALVLGAVTLSPGRAS